MCIRDRFYVSKLSTFVNDRLEIRKFIIIPKTAQYVHCSQQLYTFRTGGVYLLSWLNFNVLNLTPTSSHSSSDIFAATASPAKAAAAVLELSEGPTGIGAGLPFAQEIVKQSNKYFMLLISLRTDEECVTK